MPTQQQGLYVSLSSNARQFRTEMMTASGAVRGLGDGVGRASKSLGALKGGTAGVAVALVTGFAAAGKEVLRFDTALRNIQSITKQDEASLQALGDQAVELSRKLPQSASELAEGLYDIASSGFSGADGLEVLNASAVAASAGMTTTANAAQGISAVLNAYGKSSKDAADVSDTLFSTVNLGVTTFEQLTHNLGDYLGTAQALGVEFAETGSAIATLTLNGTTATQAGTTLGATLRGLIKPSEGLTSVMADLGYTSGTAMIESLGLRGTLMELGKATGGTAEGMSVLFADSNALAGALALTSNNGAKYAEVAGQMEDQTSRAGAAAEALAEQSKAAAFQLKIMGNNVRATALQGMRSGLPLLVDALELITSGAKETGKALEVVVGPISDAWDGLTDVFIELGHITMDLLDIFGDPVLMLAGAALVAAAKGAGAFLDVLAPLLSLLGKLTGLLADNETASLLLAGALALHLVGGVTAAATAIKVNLVAALAILRYQAGLTSGAVTALGTAMLKFLATPAGMIALLGVTALSASALADALAEPAPEMDRITAAFDNFLATGQVTGAMLEVVGQDFEKLGHIINTANRSKWDPFDVFEDDSGAQDVETARRKLEAFDSQLTKLVADGKREQAAELWAAIKEGVGADTPREVELLARQFRGYTGALKLADEQQVAVTAAAEKEAEALRGVNEVLGAGFSDLETYTKALGLGEDAAKALAEKVKGYGEAFTSFVEPLGAYSAVLDRNKEAEQAWATNVAEATKTSKDTWEDHARQVGVSVDEYLLELERMVKDQEAWAGNMLKLSSRVSAETLEVLADMGPQAAPLIAELVNASDKKLAELDELYARRGASAGASFGFGLESAGPVLTAVAKKEGQAMADKLAGALLAGKTTVAEIARQYGIGVSGQIVPAATAATEALTNTSEGMTGLNEQRATPAVTLQGVDGPGGAISKLTAVSTLIRDLAGATATPRVTVNPLLPPGLTDPADPKGDGAGRGGKVLQRIKASLPAGLRVTSTYRSPKQNAAVGGSPTSYHLDANNPAVDIAGPTHLLDGYYRTLKSAGGWRELLWKVKGHYDHIHAAATGGPITGPGTGTSDDIPAWLSNGEHVWTAKEVQAAGGHSAVEQLRAASLAPAAEPRAYATGGPVLLHPGPSAATVVQRFAAGGSVRGVGNPVKGTTLAAAASKLNDPAAIERLIAAWERYNEAVAQAAQRTELLNNVSDARKAYASAKGIQARTSALADLNAATRAVTEFDESAAMDKQRAVAERRIALLEQEDERRRISAERRIQIEDNMAERGALSVPAYLAILDKRIAAEVKYTDSWMTLVEKRERIAQDEIDKQAEAAKKIVAKRQTVEDNMARRGVISTADYVAMLDKRIAAEEEFTDDWMSLVTLREQVLQDEVDKAQKALDDLADLARDAADEAQDAADKAKDTADKALEDLIELVEKEAELRQDLVDNEADYLAERQDLLDKETELIQKRDEDLEGIRDKAAEAAEKYNADRLEAEAEHTRALAGLVGARAAQILSGLQADQRLSETWGNDVASLAGNVEDQADAIAEWAAALAAARLRGVSEAVIGALGLDEGPQALGQLKQFANATQAEIDALNAAVADKSAEAAAVAKHESENLLGKLGADITAAQQAYNQSTADAADAYAETSAQFAEQLVAIDSTFQTERARILGDLAVLQAEFIAEQEALRDELGRLGTEQGLTYGTALEAGLRSTIPGVRKAAEELEALAKRASDAATAAANAAAAATNAANAAKAGPPAATAGAVDSGMGMTGNSLASGPYASSNPTPGMSSWGAGPADASNPAWSAWKAGQPTTTTTTTTTTTSAPTGGGGSSWGGGPADASNPAWSAWKNQQTYDVGGWLQPGYTLAYNGTGQPERVLTSEQYKTAAAAGATAASIGDVSVRVFLGNRELTDIVDVQLDTALGGRRTASSIAGSR